MTADIPYPSPFLGSIKEDDNQSLIDAINRVKACKSVTFTDLVAAAGLDPAKDFRFANLQKQDFSGCDLSGFDFTGAGFRDAVTGGARFAGATFGTARLYAADVTIRACAEATDWAAQNKRLTEEIVGGFGTPLNTIKGHKNWVNGAAILDDGRILSWSDDTTLRLWDSNGAPLTTIKGHEEAVLGAAILDDGRILSWSSDSTLRLWDE